MGEEPRNLWVHLLMTAISVAGMAAVVWLEMPESQRTMMYLTTRTWLHRNLHLSALRAGRAGMGAELHEHMPSAHVGYGLAYRLARWRDAL